MEPPERHAWDWIEFHWERNDGKQRLTVKLKNKVAIVTGAGRGIGEATALALAQGGALLVLASRTSSELDRVVARTEDLGGEASIVVGDVSHRDDVERIVDETLARHGRIDMLVNVAGIYGPIGLTSEVDVDEWFRAIEVNLFGTFLCSRLALPHMINQRSGKGINFSGGGATSPLPRFSAYGVSKAAVVRYTETLAEEMKGFNIQVNAVAPGMVDTRLQDAALASGDRAGDFAAAARQLRLTGKGGVPPRASGQIGGFPRFYRRRRVDWKADCCSLRRFGVLGR